VTAAGAPSEEVSEEILDSSEQGPRSRTRQWVVPVAAVLLVLATLFGFQALQPDAPEQAPPSETGGSAADPSLVDASARRLSGEVTPSGVQGFSTALSAATEVVRLHCRADIPSWSATLISSGENYDEAIFLMSPANRRFGTFVVQVELTWIDDHYGYAVVAGHVERCI